MKFSALTFNMQFGQGWDPVEPDRAPILLDDTLAFLSREDADIIFLQEVERAQPGGKQVQPPPNFTRLHDALHEYHGVFAYPRVNPAELPFGIALAIFAKTPLVDFQAVDLPPAPLDFEFDGALVAPSHRQLIGAKTRIAGRTLQLFNTHLQAFFMINGSSNQHPEQRALVEAALRDSDAPTLLGGDFNCAPGEHLVEQFAAAGYRTAQDTEATWRRRPYVMDHLFYNAGLKVEHVEVLPTLCSDHHAVRAEFRLAQ
ncbi:MAG: endonuclease/exonuclease/phosphatase family protein [Terrimicrobiaceae bacterium]|nr:endonuclease/exonuclease/phosphatase family protein [Terrimicrobiaceae bacterium]